MKRLLNFLSITLSLIALLSAVWIIIPAPAYELWLFAVVASEWSLWLGAIALTGAVCSLLVRALYPNGKLWIASLVMGGVAFVIALFPLASVINLAGEDDVSLSTKNYFAGLNIFSEKKTNNFTTYTFAQADGKDLQLDVYLPAENKINNGASVIVVHGGSWGAGKRSDFPHWNNWLAAQGFTVFDVDYRLTPQPNYLTATGDVKCAVCWIKQHASEFKISPERIVLLGRSAGGHLALLAAYTADDQRLPSSCAEKGQNADVRGVISFYAPTDLIWSYDNPANQRVINGQETLAKFLGGSPHESNEIRERFTLASPVARVSAKTPPTLLIHGGQDQLVRPENMVRLADRLNKANVTHKTIYVRYAQHGFDYNFNGWGAQIIKFAILTFLLENTKMNK
ncbi:MAG: alpha/beta hydrolase [Acidobacteria bacterium]|nr:alpha/beta hydrolase [Acidobacteriota bacterium]